MSSPDRYRPLERFAGLGKTYASFRPTYPAEALDWVERHTGPAAPARRLVDIGTGTGISARLFAARGWPVVGVEPNADMRTVAERTEPPRGGPPPRYHAGQAEATGLPSASADVVVAAQAFHWFNAPRALAEFHRLLKPGGWAVLLWNQQDLSDPFTASYRAVLVKFSPEPEIAARREADTGRPLLVSPLFESAAEQEFPNHQDLTEEELLGRAASASYAPRDPAVAAKLTEELRQLCRARQRDDRVGLRYHTVVILGRKSDRPAALVS